MGKQPNIEYLFDNKKLRNEVGARIKEERKRKGETQLEFSTHLDIAKDTYSKLEYGGTELKLEYLYRISKYCKCDIGYLIGECSERTYKATDICKETELTPQAVDVLLDKYKSAEVLSIIIENSAYLTVTMKMLKRFISLKYDIANKPFSGFDLDSALNILYHTGGYLPEKEPLEIIMEKAGIEEDKIEKCKTLYGNAVFNEDEPALSYSTHEINEERINDFIEMKQYRLQTLFNKFMEKYLNGVYDHGKE